MFGMLPHYDQGATEDKHQDSRVSGAWSLGQNLVEERGATSSVYSNMKSEDSLLTMEKMEVDYLRQKVEPFDDSLSRLNMAGAEVVAIEPTMQSPDSVEKADGGASSYMSSKSFVSTVPTDAMSQFASNTEMTLSTVQISEESLEAGKEQTDKSLEKVNNDSEQKSKKNEESERKRSDSSGSKQ